MSRKAGIHICAWELPTSAITVVCEFRVAEYALMLIDFENVTPTVHIARLGTRIGQRRQV